MFEKCSNLNCCLVYGQFFVNVTWESGENVGAIIIRWERVLYISIKSSLISIFRFSVTNFFQCFPISIIEILYYENVSDNFSLYCLMNFFFFFFWLWFVLQQVDSLDTWDLNSSTRDQMESPTLQGRFFTTGASGKSCTWCIFILLY